MPNTMKIDIEAMAKEAGFKSRNGFIRVQHSNGSFVLIDDQLEAFARLIVERCAAECLKEAERWQGKQNDILDFRLCAAVIRSLLEDK